MPCCCGGGPVQFGRAPLWAEPFVGCPVVWGQWVPQANVGMRYTWLEPLAPLNYGEPIGFASSYLKMDASIELSPFYGGFRAGLGLRPFKVNPQIEFGFVYESYFYFKSNLEMVNADKEAAKMQADYPVEG